MKIKHYIKYAIGVFVLSAFFIVVKEIRTNETINLEFGMFTGSNWDVENADVFIMIDRAIERFEKKYPNVNVVYKSGIDKKDYSEWCAQKVLSGKLPDVFMVLDTDFNDYCNLGVLQELDSFIKRDKNFDENKFFQTALDSGKGIEGDLKQYALPYEVVPTLLFVNKTLLKKEGIEIPRKDWTWEDFYKICEMVTKDEDKDGRIDQFATYNYTWLDAMYTSGGSIFNDITNKVDFTNDKIIESLKFMKKLHELNKGENVSQEDFDTGKVAFMPLTFAEYRTYKTYPYKIKRYTNFQWDCITFPAGIDGENASKVGTLLIGMSKDSKQKNMAWEFLKELTYDKQSQIDIFKYSQGVSVLKEVAKSQEAEEIIGREMDKAENVISGELLYEVIENGVITPRFCPYNQYEQIITLANTEIADIFEKSKSIDINMKIFQRKLNQYLSK